MANLDHPKGAIPLYRMDGGSLVYDSYKISDTNSEIFENDWLEVHSDGYARPAVAGSDSIIGSAAEYKAANVGGKILFCPYPGVVFLMQSNDANVAAQTDLDLNYDLLAGTGNSLTKKSGHELDGSSKAADSTLPLKIYRVAEPIDQNGNELGANVDLEVFVSNGWFNRGT